MKKRPKPVNSYGRQSANRKGDGDAPVQAYIAAMPNEALTWLTERRHLLLRATVARFEFTFREYLVL